MSGEVAAFLEESGFQGERCVRVFWHGSLQTPYEARMHLLSPTPCPSISPFPFSFPSLPIHPHPFPSPHTYVPLLASDVHFMPVSGYNGTNLKETDRTCCPFYEGPSFLTYLDTLSPLSREDTGPVRLPILDSFKVRVCKHTYLETYCTLCTVCLKNFLWPDTYYGAVCMVFVGSSSLLHCVRHLTT